MSDLAMFYLDFIEEAGLDRIHLIGHSLGGWLAAEILIRDRSRFRSLVQLAPAGIRVKGVPCGDLFIWGPEETVRNLYHDQSFADRILALSPTEEQMDVMLQEPLHRGEVRLAAALVQSRSREVAAPDQAAGAGRLGRRRQDHAAGLCRAVARAAAGCAPRHGRRNAAISRMSSRPTLIARHVREFLEGVAR